MHTSRICQALRSLRTSRGISVREMSADLDISPHYLMQIEKGNKIPSKRLLEKYSELFSVDVDATFL